METSSKKVHNREFQLHREDKRVKNSFPQFKAQKAFELKNLKLCRCVSEKCEKNLNKLHC